MKNVINFKYTIKFSYGTFACTLLFFLFFLQTISANKPNIINFYKETYKADNKNWAVAQDTFGIMYFGNDKGLLEFDGIRWKLYTLPEAEIVRAVAVSSDNLIFTGGYEEFGLWKRDISGELVYTSLSKDLKKGVDLHNDEIWKILVSDSIIYFQSFSHIYEYDYDRVKVINAAGSGFLFLMQVYDEFFIQKIAGNLCKLTNGQLEEIPSSAFLKNTEIRVILPYQNNRYLIGTSTDGLYIFDGKTFTPWNSEFSQLVKSYQLNNGIMVKDGRYFFGTILNGVYEVDSSGKILNHFSTNNFLQNNTVLGIFSDNAGNIWTALDRGISYIQYLRGLDCYLNPFGQIGAVYSAAIFNKNLFLGTNQGLFYTSLNQLNQPGSLSNLKLVEGTEGQVWDIKTYGDKLLCGHNYGLKIIDKNLHITTSNQVNSGVYKINPTEYKENQMLLISTYYISTILSKDYKSLFNFNNIREPIIDFEIDHMGNIWLGHAEKGLYRCRFIDGVNQIKYIQAYGGDEKDGLPYHLRIFKLGERVVFLGDDTFYVYLDLEDKIVKYEEMNRCFKKIKSIRNIIWLRENLFYVIANNCIYTVYYDGYDIRIMDKLDIGYKNLSLVNIYENAVSLNDTLSLICLDNGFLLHNSTKNNIQQDTILTVPHIRSITTMNSKGKNKYIEPGKTPKKIPYSYNTLLFDFFTENVLSKNLSFEYQLKGVWDDWSEPSQINEIIFERLPSGDYTFLLRAVDNLGNYSEPLSFSFTIRPPWYATVWAVIGYIFLFMFCMVLTWFIILRRYRNAHLLKVRMREEQRLRRQNIHLQEEIEEKNAELFAQTSFIIQKNELILKVKNEIDSFYDSFSGNKILRPLYEKVSVLLNKNMNIEEDWKMFLIQFEQQHTDFFKRLKELHEDLTPNDLKLCACLKLNLSSKDIASLLNISIRGVENARYRLRKKLNIAPDQNLNDYFMQF